MSCLVAGAVVSAFGVGVGVVVVGRWALTLVSVLVLMLVLALAVCETAGCFCSLQRRNHANPGQSLLDTCTRTRH